MRRVWRFGARFVWRKSDMSENRQTASDQPVTMAA